jgi:hypothetical protein
MLVRTAFGIPLLQALKGPRIAPTSCDYVEFARDMQAGKARFTKNHKGLW